VNGVKFVRRVMVGLAVAGLACQAAAQQLTPEQLRRIQQLSPEQRSALSEQLGAGAVPSTPQAQPLEMPQTAEPKPLEPESERSPAVVQAQEGGLRPFGYDLFRTVPTTFAPASDIPVPPDYPIGPGDTFLIQFFGKLNAQFPLVVTREGALNIPELGPVFVAGLPFSEAQKTLEQKISQQMIGVQASITMGPLRSIQVFVVGDAEQPGLYTISALATATNALLASGGVSPTGSLRNIQIKRAGRIIGRLDLYQLLLYGDASGDRRLQSGDVLFIPPLGPTVGIDGQVRRPAIYELRTERTAEQLIALAGGLLPDAYPAAAKVERVERRTGRTVIDVNLDAPQGLNRPMQNGDVLRIPSVLESVENVVLLSGHVQRPGAYEWKPGMTVQDLIPSISDLRPDPDLDYVLIRRERGPRRLIEVSSIRLALGEGGLQILSDQVLDPRDEVILFSRAPNSADFYRTGSEREKNQSAADAQMASVTMADDNRSDTSRVRGRRQEQERGQKQGQKQQQEQEQEYQLGDPQQSERSQTLAPLLDAIRSQATLGAPARVVTISGAVTHPGTYPLEPGMRVSDLIRAAGTLDQSAYGLEAERTRFTVDEAGNARTELESLNLAAILSGDEQADVPLTPRDQIQIKQISGWADRDTVELRGEVRFPGTYVISRGETLRQLVERAGGLTEQAWAEGVVFTREDLRIREEEQLRLLRDRLRADLANQALQQQQVDPANARAVSEASGLLEQLESAKAVGRLSIRFPELLAGEPQADLALRPGDRLIIPRRSEEVTVLGEVNFPTSHHYRDNFNRKDYLNRSGGLTAKADEDRIYIVRANGEVVVRGGWFGGPDIRPGDTIVVPLDADRIKPLELFTSVTQVIYQLALAAAAFNAVGAF
jgi:protein involved in polysaccharide export with SLBB domain